MHKIIGAFLTLPLNFQYQNKKKQNNFGTENGEENLKIYPVYIHVRC